MVLDSLRAIVDGTVVVSATQLRALELLGKSAGVFNERLEGPRATRTSAEIETDIAKMLGCGIQLTMSQEPLQISSTRQSASQVIDSAALPP